MAPWHLVDRLTSNQTTIHRPKPETRPEEVRPEKILLEERRTLKIMSTPKENETINQSLVSDVSSQSRHMKAAAKTPLTIAFRPILGQSNIERNENVIGKTLHIEILLHLQIVVGDAHVLGRQRTRQVVPPR